MKIKAIITSILMFSVMSAKAALITSYDDNKNCQRYTLKDHKNKKTSDLQTGEKIYMKGLIYGLSLKKLSIDFENQTASADLVILKYGLNKQLGKRIYIHGQTKGFQKVINQVNRKVLTIQEVCLTDEGELIDFKVYK